MPDAKAKLYESMLPRVVKEIATTEEAAAAAEVEAEDPMIGAVVVVEEEEEEQVEVGVVDMIEARVSQFTSYLILMKRLKIIVSKSLTVELHISLFVTLRWIRWSWTFRRTWLWRGWTLR